MIAAFTIIYCICIVVVFKVVKIKPRPVPIALAVVVGVVAIGAIVIGWQLSAPASKNIVLSRYVVQIVPQVTGTIEKIHAEANVPLKKDEDILFEIEPDLFQYAVDQFEAELAAAEQNNLKLEADVEAAAAAVQKSQAELATAKAELDSALAIQRDNAGDVAELRDVTQQQKYAATEAGIDQATATEKGARFALDSATSNLKSIEAQLNTAKYNLEQCTVKAPADGFVAFWVIREGTRVSELKFATIGSFVDTSETHLVATFPQNLLKNVKSADPVDPGFKSLPGRVLTGEVDTIVNATGEGQLSPTGDLPVAADLESKGVLAVKIQLDDVIAAANLPVGAAGAVAIYTDAGKPFQVISKVYMRMLCWLNYLPF